MDKSGSRREIRPIPRRINTRRAYDSGAERARARELVSLQKAGEISDLREQTAVKLEGVIPFKTDFDYLERGRRVYEDVKGPTSERFRLICKLWRLHGPGPLRILKRAGVGSPFRVTRVIPGGKAV